jgi:hypothetical protein
VLSLLNAGQEKIDRKGQRQQDQAQGDRDVEIASARFEHRRGRQHAGLTANITADHHRSADL